MSIIGAIKWFPSHLYAFNTFYMIGGAVSILPCWILARWVHPLNEKPKRQWQCARHWCHDDKDPWFDKGGLLEDEVNPQVAKKLAMADNVGPLGDLARDCATRWYLARASIPSIPGAASPEKQRKSQTTVYPHSNITSIDKETAS